MSHSVTVLQCDNNQCDSVTVDPFQCDKCECDTVTQCDRLSPTALILQQ